MNIQLEPCPFCGGKAKFYISDHVNSDTTQTHGIYCTNVFDCGARMEEPLSGYSPDYNKQVEELKNRWNTRIERKSIVAKIKKRKEKHK